MATPSELPQPSETVDVPVGASPYELTLRLRRYDPPRARGGNAVLLLHGANTLSDTFLRPAGGLVTYLLERGREVWLLDWRGSPHVVGSLPKNSWLGGSAWNEIRHYTVDQVAAEDIPAALASVRTRTRRPGLSVLGHCVGGGALSIAAAQGRLQPFGVERLVLSTLGLFYEVPWSGWIKAEDFLLERILHESPECGGVAPDGRTGVDRRAWPWPHHLERAHECWPRAWLAARGSPGAALLPRLGFMIGQPYALERLDPRLRNGEVDDIFGPLHMGLYLHLGQMVRRGFAAPFAAPSVVDRAHLGRAARDAAPAQQYLAAGAAFRGLHTTLLCAAENQVWHRDAIDLMHEWLRNAGATSVKRVFPGHDIQELFWGDGAIADVYGQILEAL